MNEFDELQLRYHLTDNERDLCRYLMEKPRVVTEVMKYLGYDNKKVTRLHLSRLHTKRGINLETWRKKKGVNYYFLRNPLQLKDEFMPHPVKNGTNEKLFNAVNDTSKAVQQYDMNVPFWRVQLPADQVCGVVFGGDFHLGHTHTNYDLVHTYFKTIKEVPNLFTVLMGDIIDNSVNAYSPKGTTNIVDKYGQMRLVEHLLYSVGDGGKILYMIEGNHEMRSYLSDHFRVCDWLCGEHNNRYGGYGKPFTIQHGEHSYKVFVRHHAKGHSQYNPLHACIRAILFEYSEYARDADIVATAHKHESAVARYNVGGKERMLLAIGNSVNWDDYAERSGFLTGIDEYPVVVFYPGGKANIFRHFNDGVSEVKKYG